MYGSRLKLKKGSNRTWTVKAIKEDGSPLDVSAATEIIFSVKEKFEDSTHKLQKKLSVGTDEIEKVAGGDGEVFQVKVVPGDTDEWDADVRRKEYFYDIWVTLAGGDQHVIALNILELENVIKNTT
jgi:hypothetical protein